MLSSVRTKQSTGQSFPQSSSLSSIMAETGKQSQPYISALINKPRENVGKKMGEYLLYTGKYSPHFVFAPFAHVVCQLANSRLSKFICHK